MTGEEIKALRVRLKWSQKQLADFLGIEQATVSRLERDEWEPSGPVVRLLAHLDRNPPAPLHMDAAS